eukprot:579431-Pyramimonas_sp.AAC.1
MVVDGTQNGRRLQARRGSCTVIRLAGRLRGAGGDRGLRDKGRTHSRWTCCLDTACLRGCGGSRALDGYAETAGPPRG